MTVEATLYDRLSNFAGLTALVGNRIYPVVLPEDVTYPAVTYKRMSTVPNVSCMVEDTGLVRPRFQVAAWGSVYDDLVDIKEQVRSALKRWSTTGVQDTFVVEELDLYDKDTTKIGTAIEVELIYEE